MNARGLYSKPLAAWQSSLAASHTWRSRQKTSVHILTIAASSTSGLLHFGMLALCAVTCMDLPLRCHSHDSTRDGNRWQCCSVLLQPAVPPAQAHLGQGRYLPAGIAASCHTAACAECVLEPPTGQRRWLPHQWVDRPDLIVPHPKPYGQKYAANSAESPSAGGRAHLLFYGEPRWGAAASTADRQLPTSQAPAVPAG